MDDSSVLCIFPQGRNTDVPKHEKVQLSMTQRRVVVLPEAARGRPFANGFNEFSSCL